MSTYVLYALSRNDLWLTWMRCRPGDINQHAPDDALLDAFHFYVDQTSYDDEDKYIKWKKKKR